MLRMGVKFLGTLKNTDAFFFHIEDVNVKRDELEQQNHSSMLWNKKRL